jgi:putative ABC transport system permease protein
MRTAATLRVALRALRRNKMRTFLTMLGIIIGVGAVIAMVSIGNGASAMIEQRIAALGQNVILVMSGHVNRGGVRMGYGSSPTLTRDDYTAIRREVAGIVAISPEVRTTVQVSAGNQNLNTVVYGVDEDYLEVRSWPLAGGANFTDVDVRTAAKVALIGRTAARNLFDEQDPVGQAVRIRNVPFTIVGELQSKGMSMMGSDQDDTLVIPYTTALVRLYGGNSFRSMSVKAQSPTMVTEVQEQISTLLRQRHRIREDADDDFIVRTQQEIAETATEMTRIMTMLLGSIAGVSLLVGGIGIMNIMLVSVTERTREIGIRMAVGARGRDILLQFLAEAVTLSLIGGLIGILAGAGAARLIAAKTEWPTLIAPSSIALAFAFSAAVGVFFGFYPARKASRLDPIDALRYE